MYQEEAEGPRCKTAKSAGSYRFHWIRRSWKTQCWFCSGTVTKWYVMHSHSILSLTDIYQLHVDPQPASDFSHPLPVISPSLHNQQPMHYGGATHGAAGAAPTGPPVIQSSPPTHQEIMSSGPSVDSVTQGVEKMNLIQAHISKRQNEGSTLQGGKSHHEGEFFFRCALGFQKQIMH
jgi:hypothetical protein